MAGEGRGQPLSLATRREISGRPASNHSYPIRDGLVLKRGKEVVGLGDRDVMIPVPCVGVMSCSIPAFASYPLISRQSFDSGFGGSLLHEGTMIKRTKSSRPHWPARPQPCPRAAARHGSVAEGWPCVPDATTVLPRRPVTSAALAVDGGGSVVRYLNSMTTPYVPQAWGQTYKIFHKWAGSTYRTPRGISL